MKVESVRKLAIASWLAVLVMLFVRGFVVGVIGPLGFDIFALVFAVLGFVLALLCLVSVRRLGRTGILGHAIAGLIVNGSIVAIWLTNFLTYGRSR